MKYITVGLVTIFAVAIWGCSDSGNSQQSEVQSLPEALGRIQGVWEAVSTNGCTPNCGVNIDGYSVRVRFQEFPDSVMVRESALVERVDEQKEILIINGGSGAWDYSISVEDGLEYLELEFFSHSLDGNWRRMYLKRPDA